MHNTRPPRTTEPVRPRPSLRFGASADAGRHAYGRPQLTDLPDLTHYCTEPGRGTVWHFRSPFAEDGTPQPNVMHAIADTAGGIVYTRSGLLWALECLAQLPLKTQLQLEL